MKYRRAGAPGGAGRWESLLSVDIDRTAKGLDAIREAMKSSLGECRFPFLDEHQGPFEARNGSVFDQRTGQYIAYCCGNHNGCKLSAPRNAMAIAVALNKLARKSGARP